MNSIRFISQFLSQRDRIWVLLVLALAAFFLYLPSENACAIAIPPDSSEYSIGIVKLFEHGKIGFTLNGVGYPSRYAPWFSLTCLTPAYLLSGGNPLCFHWPILVFVLAVWVLMLNDCSYGFRSDSVILVGKLKDGFVWRIEHELGHRFDLVVNREKTKVLDMVALKIALAFLGYEFRKVRNRHYLTVKTYLELGPSLKSVKKFCAKVKEETGCRKLLCAVGWVVERINLVLDGWGRYFRCGYPSWQFVKVNSYARKRLYRFLNSKSQRDYRLKRVETYYGEWYKLGLIILTRRRYCR